MLQQVSKTLQSSLQQSKQFKNVIYAFSSNKKANRKQFLEELNKLDNFDQTVKEKYLNEQFKNGNQKDLDINTIKQQISEEYELKMEQIQSGESILSSMRESIFDNEELTQDLNKKDSLENQEQEPLDKYFSNLTNKEFLEKAKGFQQDLFLHRFPDPQRKSGQISSDYANYSSYENNYTYLKDTKQEWEEFDQEVYQGKRVLNFMQNLDSDIQQRKQLDTQMEELRQNNPEMSDQEIQDNHFKHQQYEINKEKNFKATFDLGENQLERDPIQFGQSQRLSPQAKEEIFRLYVKGWTVRDISTRFGILPERVKAVVWMRQKFYFEVLPNVDIRCLKLATELERNYNKENPYVDYGIDLEELNRRNKGILTPSFKKEKDVDIRALKFSKQNEEQIQENLKRKKVRSTYLTTGFHGKYEKGYYLKEWIVNYGKGSDKVSKMFKRCIHQSHNPEKLPKKVVRNLSKGPRIASLGYGHK